LLGIGKQGGAYLRALLIHGTRFTLRTTGNKRAPRNRWVAGVSERHRWNIAVALSNENARIAWCFPTRGGRYGGRVAEMTGVTEE
jgi:hypothetical protein